MLVLTRKPTEAIIVGSEIKLTVLEVSGDRVRLGIDAPKHVSIFRNELIEVQLDQPLEAGAEDTQDRPKTRTNLGKSGMQPTRTS